MVRTYSLWRDIWPSFAAEIRQLAETPGVRRVCDIGGGANPRFDLQTAEALGIEYTLSDLSATELAKAPPGYPTIHGDVCASGTLPSDHFDLVFSRYVAEHIERPEEFHRQIRRSLRPGGYAVHLFPTLFALPFVTNRLIPEQAAGAVLRAFREGREDDGQEGKFPAFYRWCRGPSGRQIRRFTNLGYEVVRYHAVFGHEYYHQRSRPIAALEERKAALLMRHPVAALTTYAVVVLRNP